MIAVNTSDYVATDVIHNLWCQHAEKYDIYFPKNEPHFTEGKPCVFKHRNQLLIIDNELTALNELNKVTDTTTLLENDILANDRVSPSIHSVAESLPTGQIKENKKRQRRSSSLHTETGDIQSFSVDDKQLKYLKKNLINERFGTTITESILESESRLGEENMNEPSFRIRYKPNDLVLTYTNTPNKNNSETPNWHGPYRIVKQEEQFYYQIEPEKGGIKTKQHVKRLRLYKNKRDNKFNEGACDLS